MGVLEPRDLLKSFEEQQLFFLSVESTKEIQIKEPRDEQILRRQSIICHDCLFLLLYFGILRFLMHHWRKKEKGGQQTPVCKSP